MLRVHGRLLPRAGASTYQSLPAPAGVRLDGATDVELSLVVASDSRCAVHMESGAAAWLGGGAGNDVGHYSDPCAAELDGSAGQLYLACLELQDSQPGWAVRGGGELVAAGVDVLLPVPADLALVGWQAEGWRCLRAASGTRRSGPCRR